MGNNELCNEDVANNIKSEDLCNRCEYGYYMHCANMQTCAKCGMYTGETCKCTEVKKHTPCPYFCGA